MALLTGRTLTKQVTIADSGTTSGPVTAGPFTTGAIQTPASLEGTAMTFVASHAADGTFVGVEDASGAAVGLTVESSKTYQIPAAVMAFAYFKIVMGTSQTGAAIFTITLKG